MSSRNYASLYDIYKLTLELCGDNAKNYQKSLRFFSLAYISKGIVFGLFYPLLQALFNPAANNAEIGGLLCLMLLFSLVSLMAKWKAYDFDFTGGAIDVAHLLRTDLGEQLRRIPLEKLSQYKTGDLNSIFSSNVDESLMVIGTVSSMILQLVLLPLTIIVVTLFVDVRLAILMMLLFPLTIPLYRRIRSLTNIEKNKLNQSNAVLEAQFIEYIQGLPVLRSFNSTGDNAEQLQQAIDEVADIQQKGLYKTQLPSISIGLLIEATLLVLLSAGSYWVLNDSLALVILGASVVIVARLIEPLNLFINLLKAYDAIDASFKRIKSILDIKPLPVMQPIAVPEHFDIKFDRVSFHYEGYNDKAINHISFELPSKTMTAIVGDSGSGKTTITKLLTRYADSQQGKITIGGINIKNMSPKQLMKHISVVFQDVYLFDDTIFNNIQMAKPEATIEEVHAAAKAAHCHEFISKFPQGYDTIVGEIGGNLSGGEKQRISIARAILKGAPIVILDEPTAALDTESEIAVQQAIDALMQDKTVIVIAHRLSTITGADKIMVMEKGKISETGTHAELINNEGKYFRMWRAQQRVKDWDIINTPPITEQAQ